MPEVVEKQAEAAHVPPPVAPRRFVIPDDPAPVAEPVAPAASAPEPKPGAQDTGTKATPAEPEGEKPEEVTPEQAAKREGRRFERKLDKAYRKAAEAQARADLLEKQLAELRQPKEPEGAPTLEQFEYDPEKYAAAKAEFAKKQAQKEFETKRREESESQYNQKLLAEWEDKVEKASDKYDDFNAVIASSLDPKNPVAAAIMEAENGADILHFLGTNPQEAKRLDALNVRAQIREIGKIEAKLLAKPVEPKAPSKAPAPITPLSGTATVTTPEPSESDDMKTWIRKREKQLGRR